MLQHVMVVMAVLLLLGCSGACTHQHGSIPRPLMHMMQWLQVSQHNEQHGSQMMHAMLQAQPAFTSSSSAAAVAPPATADPVAPGASCATLHEKQQCTESKACLWCQNKHSPWPGSDGVCVEPDQAKYLPDTTYTCTPQPTTQPEEAPAAAAAPQGGSQSCGTVRDKKQCSTQKDCIWCQNKHSPWPGSDGVCVDLDQAKYLPPSAYKCDSEAANVLLLQTSSTADKTKPSPTADKTKPDASKACSAAHDKDNCTTRQDCIWCRNKFSPWSGSDGVCIEPKHAYELPKWTYKCDSKQSAALAAA